MTRLYIAGHTGLLGAALVRRFAGRSDVELLTATRSELDLTRQAEVAQWLAVKRPDAVILAAARVGGILANSRQPADFIYQNLMIETNVIHGAWAAGVRHLVNFGTSCMYPKVCPQPMHPSHLMTGQMEPTSEPYAIAKWAGLVMCDAYHRQHGAQFFTVIPSTLYGCGPGSHFDPVDAHVLGALIMKFHEANVQGRGEVVLWGSGHPRREFLYADDLAEACELLLSATSPVGPVINVGSGESLTIRELAALIADIVGFRGTVSWDPSKPDGTLEKCLDTAEIRRLGWSPRTDLRTGIERTYQWFCQHVAPDFTAASRP